MGGRSNGLPPPSPNSLPNGYHAEQQSRAMPIPPNGNSNVTTGHHWTQQGVSPQGALSAPRPIQDGQVTSTGLLSHANVRPLASSPGAGGVQYMRGHIQQQQLQLQQHQLQQQHHQQQQQQQIQMGSSHPPRNSSNAGNGLLGGHMAHLRPQSSLAPAPPMKPPVVSSSPPTSGWAATLKQQQHHGSPPSSNHIPPSPLSSSPASRLSGLLQPVTQAMAASPPDSQWKGGTFSARPLLSSIPASNGHPNDPKSFLSAGFQQHASLPSGVQAPRPNIAPIRPPAAMSQQARGEHALGTATATPSPWPPQQAMNEQPDASLPVYQAVRGGTTQQQQQQQQQQLQQQQQVQSQQIRQSKVVGTQGAAWAPLSSSPSSSSSSAIDRIVPLATSLSSGSSGLLAGWGAAQTPSLRAFASVDWSLGGTASTGSGGGTTQSSTGGGNALQAVDWSVTVRPQSTSGAGASSIWGNSSVALPSLISDLGVVGAFDTTAGTSAAELPQSADVGELQFPSLEDEAVGGQPGGGMTRSYDLWGSSVLSTPLTAAIGHFPQRVTSEMGGLEGGGHGLGGDALRGGAFAAPSAIASGSSAAQGGHQEWTSPFASKDLFSRPQEARSPFL
eukprot:TRINITY_DN186_c0_g2_i1.p1 TRINITY_DN186_c0_g2~~TRINITY_DN186_c0_g2_i1.p1  ORF type:complete len:676 (-),score=180.55 TRINITY_DN186_c0_g2_i1:31-1875(-)